MITAAFRIGEYGIESVKVSGHADSGEYGKDIVCAAVSSATIMVANTITDVLKVDCKINCKDGYLSIKLKEKSSIASDVLEGLRLHLTELSKEYSQYVTVTNEV